MNTRQDGTCPTCGSDARIFRGLRVEGDTVVYNYTCMECKQEFTEEEPLEFPEN